MDCRWNCMSNETKSSEDEYMMYLSRFHFPDIEREYTFLMEQKRTCYDSFYPFKIISQNGLKTIDFEPITILYGGNGCGKTTVLNVIAEKLGLIRDTLYNCSSFFEDYIHMCSYDLAAAIPGGSRIITSDDVFDFMLNLRMINEQIDKKREDLFEDYLDAKYAKFQMRSLDDYEQLKKVNYARSRSKSQSKYVRQNLLGNIREHSNGESAFIYFSEKISDNCFYLLDEPENSLSPKKQQELAEFLETSARFFGCQFVIATHSPFLLSIHGAKVYDMDENPVDVKHWTQLDSVRSYYDFFKKHEWELLLRQPQ